uniref:Uncharacterized protein n=1 Tax=Arundo donax TaxID=35708 RepID=A0A0A9CDC5_ARUDO
MQPGFNPWLPLFATNEGWGS